MKKGNKNLIIFLILILAFFVRIFLIDKIPAELWGDVNEHFHYAREILKGNLKIKFWAGDGPIFDYLVALFFKIFGYSFETVKLTSVFLGTIIIFLSYLISRKLTKEKNIHFLVIYLMSFSFWLISFSRQAKPYILVLFFVELFFYLFLQKKFFLSGIILGTGLFTQSSFWGMIFLAFLNWKIFFGFLPFFIFLYFNEIKPEIINNNLSYLGEKIEGFLPIKTKIYNFFSNIFYNFQSYFFKGDIVFRHNIPNQPILDLISSIIFFIGLIIFTKELIKNKKIRVNYAILLLIFIFSQFASFLDVANPQSSPNFGRMIGSAFFIYYILAIGVNFIFIKIKSKSLLIGKLFLISYLLFYFIFNFYNYFFVYPKTLPNKNTPFGRIIVEDIVKNYSEKNYKVILYNCCWGEWGQPEPKSIENYLISLDYKNFKNYYHFYQENELCYFMKQNNNKKIVLYTNFNSFKKDLNCINNFKNINFNIISANNFYISDKIILTK